MNNPKLSIIIPTYNRKDMLESCLNSLFNQTYPEDKYEIIIVDGDSTDGTEEFIKQLQQKNQNLCYLKQHSQNPAAARNLGIKHAQGEICVFTDSDCLTPDNFLEEIMKCFKNHPGIAACVGTETPLYKNRLFLALSDYYKLQYKNKKGKYIIFSKLSPEVKLISNCCAIKKDVFLAVGSFDTKLAYCEDVDLGFRILENGFKVCLTYNIFVYHHQRDTIKKQIIRTYKFGLWGALIFKSHFKHWFALGLPFNKWIYFSHAPFAFYLHIDLFKRLIVLLIFSFFYPKIGIIIISLYFLIGYVIEKIIERDSKPYFIFRLYRYLEEGSLCAGRIVGSIKNKVFYI